MELNDLIIFKTVANEGSISKAAKELGYVQPNVTERIKKLEHELDTPLLHRDHKGVTLLPSGEILLDYTNQILHLIEKAKHEIKMTNDSYRIATTQSILSIYLSNRIKDHFHKFQIYLPNSSELPQLLKKQAVDMIITYLDIWEPSIQKVFTTGLQMGLLKAKCTTTIDYKKEYYFISHDQQCPFRRYTLEFIAEHGISKEQIHQVDSYSLVMEFVANGKGLAFLPVNNLQLDIIKEVPIVEIPIHFFISRGPTKGFPIELFN
ncbi:LysR family transcriptional regulator [Neobacillus sp. Marseille-QA0830]